MATAAASGDSWLRQVLARMRLHAGDARELSPQALAAIDVIYLDPMFPARGKSAAVKKDMALFQRLLEQGEHGTEDADALWHWAMDCDAARVVVKRPPRAPSLAASSPSHSLGGKAVRYDVYVRRGLG
jgi:16S rRNA (guanine1516-N2)-methyltransferase